ncbi:hypothetical protein [Myxosarcina sp. GI1(2024)]
MGSKPTASAARSITFSDSGTGRSPNAAKISFKERCCKFLITNELLSISLAVMVESIVEFLVNSIM